MSIPEILETITPFQVQHVLVTGGEPLLQRNTPQLITTLLKNNYIVSIETHGEVSIEKVAPFTRIIMDIKTPSSKMSRGYYVENLKLLKPEDEIKFVIASQEDYFWAVKLIRSIKLPTKEVIFSPVMESKDSPGKYAGVEPKWLAEQILKDKLPVRMQLQLHKLIWGNHTRGV